MFSLKNVEKRLLVTLVVCSILSVIFIGVAFALTDEDYDYTTNLQGYAYVKGKYNPPPDHYYETYHKGQLSVGADEGGWTKFAGFGGTSPYGWTHDELEAGEYAELSVDPANVITVFTVTFEREGGDFARACVAVGLEP